MIGKSVPWAVIRRDIARLWNCFPWQVDDAPYDEILQELKLAEIEQKMQKEVQTKNKPSMIDRMRGR